jgi:hypothetical protein
LAVLKLKINLCVDVSERYSARNKQIACFDNHLGAATKVILFVGVKLSPLLKEIGYSSLENLIGIATGAALDVTFPKFLIQKFLVIKKLRIACAMN